MITLIVTPREYVIVHCQTGNFSCKYRTEEPPSLILFNQTKLRTFIHTFIKRNRLQSSPISIAIDGAELKESLHSLIQPHSSLEYLWRSCLLPAQSSESIQYMAGISHRLLMQYHLLCIQIGLNLSTLIPVTLALIAYTKARRKIVSIDTNTSLEDYKKQLFKNLQDLEPETHVYSYATHSKLVAQIALGVYYLYKCP
jgi:hypothetical protein